MRIRGDLRNTIQTISPHSTPPIGIESTMFFDFHSAGGVPPKSALAQIQLGPPFTCPGRFRQTGLSRLVSAYSTTSVWLSCHSVESVTELIFIMEQWLCGCRLGHNFVDSSRALLRTWPTLPHLSSL